MAVKKLSSNIQSLFSSSVHLFSYKRAIEELVYNALDAQSTSIAIRLHIQENKIQIVDNGCGIAKEDFGLLGQKYATSKFVDLSQYKSAPNSYGFRGQSLASLVEVSKHVKITARVTNTEDTWTKTFYKGKGNETSQTTTRPSKGTTVEVNGFLYNFNIQNKSIKPINEMNDIKILLEQLSFVHNNVSFSLRDDSRNEIIFKTHKNSDIYQTLKSLFDIEKSDVQELQVEKSDYKILAYIARDKDHPDCHNWIFLNKKFVNNTKLNKLLYDNFTKTLNPLRRVKSLKKSKNTNHVEDYEPSKISIPFYFIFITCPFYEYDISNTPRQSTLEFKNWNQITKLIEKLVKFYAGDLKVQEIKKTDKVPKNKNMLKENNETEDTRQQVREIMKKILGSNPKKVGVSQMHNGIKGKLIKRKKKKAPKLTFSKEVPPKEQVGFKGARKLSLSNVIPPKVPVTIKNKNPSKDIMPDQIRLDERPDDIFKIDKPSHKTMKTRKTLQKANLSCNKIQNTQEPKRLTKVSKKNKNKRNKDALIEIFRKQPKLVVERCNLLAQEVEHFIKHNRKQRVFINETVNYSHVIKDNKNYSIRKRVGEIVIHDYSPLKPSEKPHVTHTLAMGDIKKESLKTTYDLLKTIIGTKSTNTQNSMLPGNFCDPQNQNLGRNKAKVPQLTYQSHHYSNHTLSHHHHYKWNYAAVANEKIKHFKKIGNLILDNATVVTNPASPIQSFQKKLEYDLLDKQENNKKPKKRRIFEKPKAATKQFNIPSFSEKFTSHTIEFSDGKEEIVRKKSTEINDKTYEIPNKNTLLSPTVVTSTIGFTYTITTSNKHANFNPSSEYWQNDWTSRLTYCETGEVFSKKRNYPQADQLNVIFISNSNETNCEKSNNNDIEPLYVCETIMNSSNELDTGTNVKNNQNQLNDSLFNLTLGELSSDVRNFDIIGDTQQHVKSPSNQFSSVERAIVYVDNQEVLETLNDVRDTIEKDTVEIGQVIDTDNQEAFFNTAKLGERAPIEKVNDKRDTMEVERVEVGQMIDTDIKEAVFNTVELGGRASAKDFDMRNRLRFLPKGMSPIFENRCLMKTKIDDDLESGYFADDLYSKFRDEVQANTDVYEAHVQNPKDFASKNLVKVNNRLDKDNSSLTFNAVSLKGAKVLGQTDNKFIAALLTGKSDQSDFFVLFDQHAVHERIRLEKNLADYFNNNEWRIAKLDDVLLKLSKDEILYLHNYKDKFTQFGLEWTIQNNFSIILHGIPAAILGKNPRQVERVISAVKSLISEAINMIRSQKGCVSLYPKSIMDLVFSEACRYAIKFGDKLPQSECIELIQALSTCKTPFQCAHGRPVMAVIMDIKPEMRSYQINLAKVRQLQAIFSKNNTK